MPQKPDNVSNQPAPIRIADMNSKLRTTILAAAVVLGATGAALACTEEDFGKAVDTAGGDLRAFNLASAPKLQARIAELKSKKGWGEDGEEMAHDYLSDARMMEFDRSANDLLDKIDTLGRVEPGQQPDCAKLDDLKAASSELLAVMKAKSAYTMAKLDKELGAAPVAPAAATAPPPAAETPPAKPANIKTAPPPASPVAPKTAAAPAAAKGGAAPKSEKSEKAEAKPAQPAAKWSTEVDVAANAPVPPPPGPPAQLPPGALMDASEGYTIDEIKDATKGVFGTVSTNLAAVLEHAFSYYGRPSAYVLGKEGGGAFLAGVRYGSGTLYFRQGGTRQVHWHGPSVGYDVGVAGSRTLFLIYGLKDPEAIYRSYTGLDGSAYVVGGIGLTVLKGGPVIMAPIRSGVGLRVGANLGYVRFTREKSWNPF